MKSLNNHPSIMRNLREGQRNLKTGEKPMSVSLSSGRCWFGKQTTECRDGLLKEWMVSSLKRRQPPKMSQIDLPHSTQIWFWEDYSTCLLSRRQSLWGTSVSSLIVSSLFRSFSTMEKYGLDAKNYYQIHAGRFTVHK